MTRVRVLLMLAVMASSVLTVGGAGAEHSDAAISGTVRGAAAEPLAGLCVIAHEWNDEYWGWAYVDEAATGPDGSYTIALFAGTFIIEFRDCDGNTNYLGEWYDDTTSPYDAERIALANDEHREGIDATLALGGSISGTVTDEDTGAPVSICVSAEGGTDDDYAYETAYPDGQGSYTIRKLPPGQYRVRFGECVFYDAVPAPGGGTASSSPPPVPPSRYVSEWYDDEELWENADLVTVVGGADSSGIDAQLVVGGSISGEVLTADGDPLEAVCIEVWDAATRRFVASADGWAGSYLVTGLRAGSYKVLFSDCWAEWQSEWFDDKRTFVGADAITVVLREETTGVDAVLGRARMVDLAVTEILVEQVPLQALGRRIAPLGWEQDITVEFSNIGTKRQWGGFYEVWVEMVSDGSTFLIGRGSFERIDVGASIRETFQWHAMGAVGDAVVHARICSYANEPSYRNNQASARAHVLVGGTGMGRSPLGGVGDGSYQECYDDFNW